MPDREDENFPFGQPVDDSISAVEDLSNVFPPKLWNDSAAFGKVGKLCDGIK